MDGEANVCPLKLVPRASLQALAGAAREGQGHADSGPRCGPPTGPPAGPPQSELPSGVGLLCPALLAGTALPPSLSTPFTLAWAALPDSRRQPRAVPLVVLAA